MINWLFPHHHRGRLSTFLFNCMMHQTLTPLANIGLTGCKSVQCLRKPFEQCLLIPPQGSGRWSESSLTKPLIRSVCVRIKRAHTQRLWSILYVDACLLYATSLECVVKVTASGKLLENNSGSKWSSSFYIKAATYHNAPPTTLQNGDDTLMVPWGFS